MAVTHSEATRNALADLVVARVDAGAGVGRIEMRASDESVVATLPLNDPSFGPAAAGVVTANPITDDTNAVGGTMDHAVILDDGGTEIFRASVTATGGGGDIELDSVVISADTEGWRVGQYQYDVWSTGGGLNEVLSTGRFFVSATARAEGVDCP